MALKFAITGLDREQVAFIPDYSDARVTIPYNDSRTAEVTIPASSQAVSEVFALSRMLKAWYIWPDGTSHLVFWGPIITPTWTLRAGQKTLRIEAHDMSLRLKHHYLSGADESIFDTEPGTISVDYLGLRALRDAGMNAAAENTAGVPDLGIGDGTNSHSGAYAWTVTTADFEAGDTSLYVESTIGFPTEIDTASDDTVEIDEVTFTNFTYTGREALRFTGVDGSTDIPAGSKVFYNVPRELQVNKGAEIWETWRTIADDPFGPDFRLRPDEAGDDYALLETFDKTETAGGDRDKRFTVIFQAGFGTDNVEDFTYAPQGGSVRNRAVVQQAHSDPDEADRVAIESNLASRIKYGNYVSWDAGGDKDTTAALHAKAQAVLLAYSEPPQSFTFTPRADTEQRFIFGRDYEEGDVISCAAHFGGSRIWLPGFISEVRLKQQSATGQTKAEIDALPEIVAQTDVGDEG